MGNPVPPDALFQGRIVFVVCDCNNAKTECLVYRYEYDERRKEHKITIHSVVESWCGFYFDHWLGMSDVPSPRTYICYMSTLNLRLLQAHEVAHQLSEAVSLVQQLVYDKVCGACQV